MARLDRRLELDARLRRILGSNNLYYEPPASLKMKLHHDVFTTTF